MTKEKKNTTDKQKKTKNQKKENELDKELRQSFPASDPPSHTRPGHERTEEDKDKS